MSGYYDRAGEPISIERYMELSRDRSYKVVGQWNVDNMFISTVWLGLDHSWDENSAPLIYETMVFGGPLDGYQERYTDDWAAVLGHARIYDAVLRARASYTRRKRTRLRRALNLIKRWDCVHADNAFGMRGYRTHQTDSEALKKAATLRRIGHMGERKRAAEMRAWLEETKARIGIPQ